METKKLKEKQTFIRFDNDTFECGFYVIYAQRGDLCSVKIPAYKLSFTASSIEESREFALNTIRSFFGMWEKEGWDKFFSYIHKHLNFKASPNQKLIERPFKIKFISPKGELPEIKSSEIHYEVLQCVPHKF